MPVFAAVLALTGLPCLGLLFIPGNTRRRKMVKIAAIFGLLFVVAAIGISCGGSGGFSGAPTQTNAGTPAGTYSITVTAMDGTTSVPVIQNTPTNTPFTLIVQ